ncbi:hypothetical protein D9615_002987 [Tricholomella constricta]|uniref:Serine hydrolase domain-containing protein n=1 Tax=Tricholomella constricta TaxID=117010 RepID=A0A8H5HGE5_9AGAR|nr:hypothetical protein D9615_002987 [Tricholomella constricta]
MEAPRTTVLVLHGYSQNASTFSKRLAALRRECGNAVEFVFVNAPHVMRPVDLPGSTLASFGALETGNFANADSTFASRAWWKLDEDRTSGHELIESIVAIRDVLITRRFDVHLGVFGFSQGAALASIISLLLERPHLCTPFLVKGQPPHPPFKFCVAVSGFRLREPFCDSLFTNQYSTPTLHVIGRNDVIVTEEKSKRLIETSSNRRVEEHDGGHFVPSKRLWLQFLRDYMIDPSAHLPSPGIASSSVPSSGTVTPIDFHRRPIMMVRL